jgi:hypothetical protein
MTIHSRKPLLLLAGLAALIFPISTLSWSLSRKPPSPEFKPAEKGWWEVQDGILARWCSNKYPCPQTKALLKNSWRLHVWCRSSDCGNISAYANIYDGKIIVANDATTAIADFGDKLILTFTSETKGTAVRLVRFSATGGTKNRFPLILPSGALSEKPK